MATFVTLGEPLVAFVAEAFGPLAEADTYRRHVAGAELNTAIGVSRLGHAASFVGRVGDDGFGTIITRRLRAEAVDVTHLTVDSGRRTAILVREKRLLGPAEVFYYRADSAGAALGPIDVDRAADVLRSASWVHLTGITPALSKSAAAAIDRALDLLHDGRSSIRPTISLDINLRRKLWSAEAAAVALRRLIPRVDIVMASLDEASVMIGEAPPTGPDAIAHTTASLTALGAKAAILKLGELGAAIGTPGLPPTIVPGIELPVVVDPVGAGDAFCAGFIAAKLDGLDDQEALRRAVACGASVAACDGDLTGLPTLLELEQLLGPAPDAVR